MRCGVSACVSMTRAERWRAAASCGAEGWVKGVVLCGFCGRAGGTSGSVAARTNGSRRGRIGPVDGFYGNGQTPIHHREHRAFYLLLCALCVLCGGMNYLPPKFQSVTGAMAVTS